MRKLIPFIFLLVTSIISCKQSASHQSFNYGTENDSALYYFNKGWEQILDLGQWSLSEQSFRKAVAFDDNFMIGKSLVGRISGDLAERQDLFEEIWLGRDQVSDDERLLLNIFISNINIMNLRGTSSSVSTEVREKHTSLAERNFRNFIHKYPGESYMKAEYIETLHALYGAEQALDSLTKLASPEQATLPFYITYSAILQTELGDFRDALANAEKVKTVFNDANIPQQYVLLSEIYYAMDSLETAKVNIDRAVELDPKHLIAQGMKTRIERQMSVNE
ncbi:MAG: hypothetical protein ABJG78_21295 [Cyclobacteriaceae bacterium]